MGAIIPLRRELSLIRQAKNRKPEDWSILHYFPQWTWSNHRANVCLLKRSWINVKFFFGSTVPELQRRVDRLDRQKGSFKGEVQHDRTKTANLAHTLGRFFHSFQEICCQDIPDAQFTDRSVAKRFQVQNVSDLKSDLAKQNHQKAQFNTFEMKKNPFSFPFSPPFPRCSMLLQGVACLA